MRLHAFILLELKVYEAYWCMKLPTQPLFPRRAQSTHLDSVIKGSSFFQVEDKNSKTRYNLLLDRGIFRELCVVGKRLHVETGKVGKIFREKRMVYQGFQNLLPSLHTILSKVPKFLCREMIASLLVPSRKALPALCTPDRLGFQRQRPCRLSYYLSETRDRAYGSQVLPSMSEWIELRVVQTRGQNTWIMIQGELSKMTGNLS